MPHARLTHPTRPTLEFRQGQSDSDSREAVANVTAELGVDRPPLVHTETRERSREIQGRVTGPRRAANDGSTSDWRQALANYVDLLESHVDEFQGTGYTFEGDQLDTSLNSVYESIEWALTPGVPDQFTYTATVLVGQGTFEEQAIGRRNPTYDTGMSVPAIVDGNDLPGLRDLRVRRSIGVEPRPIYDRDSAENNDLLITEGVQQTLTYEGTHTGGVATRRAADDALDALVATKNNVTLQTKFPGYELDGFVTNYESDFEARHGVGRHDFRLEFIEGQRA